MDIVPIKKVFRVIDSCTNVKQLRTCEKLAEIYTDMVKKKGVVNPSQVKECLYIKINEKREELQLSHKFNGKIRRKKFKHPKLEDELVENFL
jgi:hypothetical protein